MRDKADACQMEITSITWEYEKITKELNPDEINYKPGPQSWSIAENLAHLIQLNSTYFSTFDQIMEGIYKAPIHSRLPFVVNFIGSLLHRTMSSKTKTKTFSIWEPDRHQYGLDILNHFSSHQMELSAYIQKLEPFLDNGTVIHSPANRLLVYDLDKALDILLAHEKRHLLQCRHILTDIK